MHSIAGPLVSVIIPTYYRNDALQDAVESVLDQTYDSVEVIVVDDSGRAHAEDAISQYEDVLYIAPDSNHGSNRARSLGFERANGKYVHFLDDDDWMFEDKLKRQVAMTEGNESIGVVYTGIEKSGGRVNLPNPEARGEVLERALKFEMWPCMTSTMLIEADLVDQILPFSNRPGGDDLDMMIRLARLTEFDFVDAPLLFKRLGDESRGYSTAAVEGRFQIIEDYRALYATFPPAVRNAALADSYETLVRIEFMEHAWSIRAIVAVAYHYYYSSWTDPKAAAKFVAAIFGRPGWRLIRYVGQSSS